MIQATTDLAQACFVTGFGMVMTATVGAILGFILGSAAGWKMKNTSRRAFIKKLLE